MGQNRGFASCGLWFIKRNKCLAPLMFLVLVMLIFGSMQYLHIHSEDATASIWPIKHIREVHALMLPDKVTTIEDPTLIVWPINQTRDVHALVLPNNVTTRIAPSNLCSNPSSENQPSHKNSILLLVVVCSALENTNERQTIRETWAKDQDQLRSVRVVFMVGNSLDDILQPNIMDESKIYGDIIQEYFLDTYANLTIKSLMVLKWFTTSYCKDVSYVMKTDDDMYINLEELYNLVAANKQPYLLTGALICGAKPIRDPHNKWHSPLYMYPETVYPQYVSGTAYVMSNLTASILFKTALTVPAFHLEDIYITGMLPAKASEIPATRPTLLPGSTGSNKAVIKPKDDYRFMFFLAKNDACVYNKIISSHHLTMSQIRTMYQKVLKVRSNPENCPNHKPTKLRPYTPSNCK